MKSINDLEQGINGFKVITDVLEKMMKDLSDNKVPLSWGESYFSLKPLGSWITDLVARYKFFNDWYSTGQPSVFWISAFTYPTGFTTSLLQKFSRKPNNPAIDCL
jgi:dynein heavy chain